MTKAVLTNPGQNFFDVNLNGTMYRFPPGVSVMVDEAIAPQLIQRATISGCSLTMTHAVVPDEPAPAPEPAAPQAPATDESNLDAPTLPKKSVKKRKKA